MPNRLGDFEILVVGSINADLIIHPRPKLPGSNYALADDFHLNLGGKGLNQALSALADGGHVALCGCVGQDVLGSHILQELSLAGLSTDLIRVEAKAQTGVGHVRINPDGEYDTVVFLGANEWLTGLNLEALVSPTLRAVIMNFEIPAETIRAAANFFASRGVTVFLNYSPVLPESSFDLGLADFAVMNLDEARAILGMPGASGLACVNAWFERSGNGAIVTDGANGTAAIDRDGVSEFLLTPQVKVANTVGAGDTFLAVFVTNWVRNVPFTACIRNASIAAAIVCGSTKSYLTSKHEDLPHEQG